ncbi:MAG: CpXC domain-containing protein [Lachnospiraceae bacterium]|nr:CpXC domain-containing protein [Lachnospiraceae bacterium]
MSIKNERTIKCPKCGKEFKVNVWNSINLSENPELKEKVLSGEVFQATCDECKEVAFLEYNMLYHDDENDMMLHLVSGELTDQQVIDSYIKATDVLKIAREEYIMRITKSPEQLREKVYIFDQGLDDRAIEIMKLVILSKIKNEVKADIEEIILRTEKDNEEPKMFLFRTSEKKVGSVPFIKELYEDIETKHFADSPRGKSEYVVNFIWASEFMKDIISKSQQ